MSSFLKRIKKVFNNKPTRAVLDDNAVEEAGQSVSEPSTAKVRRTPLPKGEMFCVLMLMICEAFHYTFLFSFVGFMVVDLGLVSDERKAGYYAALITGCYSAAQCFSGFIFGIIADRYSKKVVVVVSTFFSAVGCLMFGFSTNLWWAMFWRTLGGFLNGGLVVAKAYLSKITDETNQGLGWTFTAFGWSIGAIIGPTFSGFTARLNVQYPEVFGKIWLIQKFPYLIPCLGCVFMLSFTTIVSLIFLKHYPSIEKYNPKPNLTVSPTDNTGKSSNWKAQALSVLNDHRQLLTNKDSLVSLITYQGILVVYYTIEEVFPLWALISVNDGGLSFNTANIGTVQALTGAIMFVWGALYPIIERKIAALTIHRLCYFLVLPMVFTPQLGYLSNSPIILWIVLFIVYIMARGAFDTMSFNSIFIVMNNAAPNGKQGLMHGIGTSVGNMSRTLAPFLAGPLLAFSSSLHIPLNLNIPFFLFGVIGLFSFFLTFLLSNDVNKPKVVPEPSPVLQTDLEMNEEALFQEALVEINVDELSGQKILEDEEKGLLQPETDFISNEESSSMDKMEP